MKNLIMGVAKGYGWNDLEPFVISCRRNCPSADLVLFVDNLSDFTSGKLEEGGVLIQKISGDLKAIPLMNSRFIMYKKFIDAHKEYDKILVTDVRDVIFQGDLFKHYAKRENFLLYAEEACPIKYDPGNYNQSWIKNLFGENEYLRLANKIIICAGTILATNSAMSRLFETMLHYFENKHNTGEDQATLNYLVHNKLLPVENVIASDVNTGEILTVALFKDYSFAGDKILRGNGGVPAVVHQYDRHASMVQLVNRVYREKDFQPDESFTDARSVLDQTYCLVFRQNWSTATKFFISHSLDANMNNFGENLLKLWLLTLQVPTQNFDAETLAVAVQSKIPAAFSKNLNTNQMENIYAAYLYSEKNHRAIHRGLKIFVVNMLTRFVDIFYRNGQRDWCLTYIERLTGMNLPLSRETYLLQAKIYRETGRKEDALKAYEKALDAT